MSIEQDISNFKQELAPQFASFSQLMQQKVQSAEEVCFASTKANEKKFIDCMVTKNKAFSRTEKNLGFRMAYLDLYLGQCFKQAKEEKKPYDTCKKDGIEKFKKFTDDVTNDLK